jgi:hypothetical protein
VVLHGHWYPPPVLAAIEANYDTAERVGMNGTAYLLLKPKG